MHGAMYSTEPGNISSELSLVLLFMEVADWGYGGSAILLELSMILDST